MNDAIIIALISAVAGLLTGLASSVLTAYTQIQVERIKSQPGGGIVTPAGERLAQPVTRIFKRVNWKITAPLTGLAFLVTIIATSQAIQLKGSNSQPAMSAVNLTRRFDFEDGLPEMLSMGICDNTPSWYDICYEAPTRFTLSAQSFTGKKSVACQIEILPDKEQVYSLRLPIDPPMLADTVSAHIHTDAPEKFTKITLAARVKGNNIWIFSDMKLAQSGWVHFMVDLLNFKNVNNLPAEIAIDEIHIDMFIKQGQQALSGTQVLIDTLELYYPLARSFQTGP